MSIKETLFSLSDATAVGNITEAANLAYNMLSEYCPCEKGMGSTVFGFLKGESDYTIMLDAHIDQIAFVVTDIDDNGFLTVSNVGGIDLRMLPSRRVIIHSKQKVMGVFCATPPHLSVGETEYNDISKIKIDTALGEKAKDIIEVGDFVTFSTTPFELLSEKVAGPYFDNRAGVACLIETAKRLKDEKLPVNVAFVFSDGEELGLRGTRTATFKVNPEEAIVVDTSFGLAPEVKESVSGRLGFGAMIGISPCLDSTVSKKLIDKAKEKGINYQTEVMASTSGTNADMIAVTREGVKTGTVSIPIRNMHTDCEILSLKDLEDTTRLLCEYIRNGGAKND